MAYDDDVYRFQHNFDYGRVDISTPRKLSLEDVTDLEAHFNLILSQCRRRAGRDTPSNNMTVEPIVASNASNRGVT